MTRTERIERTFSVPDGCQLEVSNIRGSITVTGGESDQVRIVALKRFRLQQQAEQTEIDIGQEGRRVWARTRVHRQQGWRNLWRGGRAASVDYVIALPRPSQVEASSVSGSVEVSSIEGQVSIETVSGSVTVRDVQGPVSTKSVSGEVKGQTLRGQLHIETVSGRTNVAESDFSSLRAITVSGPLKIATPLQPTGEYRVQTVSGDVEFIVPETASCTVEGHSISGRLRTTLVHASQRQGFATWRTEVGGGGVPLHFDSVSGNLILTVAQGRAAVELSGSEASEMVSEAEPETTLSTMAVLKAIEAGQLSVEEGVVKLKELKHAMEVQHDSQ